jgi:hypothetical protein
MPNDRPRPRNDSTKQLEVLAYIRKHQPVPQPKITKHFYKEFDYLNMNSARVAVGMILKKLEGQGLASKTTAMNEVQGSIDKNIWSAR